MKKDDCIFCKLANGDIPTNVIYEDEDFTCILDADPATKGHTLILPKNHADCLYDLDENSATKALLVAQKLAKNAKEKLGCAGVNIVQNNEAAAGQTVPHFHIHVIPRYNDDPDKTICGWSHQSFTDEEIVRIKDCLSIKA